MEATEPDRRALGCQSTLETEDKQGHKPRQASARKTGCLSADIRGDVLQLSCRAAKSSGASVRTPWPVSALLCLVSDRS